MRWPWWHRQRAKAPLPAVNPRRQELETAKEILAEVFGARPPDPPDLERMLADFLLDICDSARS